MCTSSDRVQLLLNKLLCDLNSWSRGGREGRVALEGVFFSSKFFFFFFFYDEDKLSEMEDGKRRLVPSQSGRNLMSRV